MICECGKRFNLGASSLLKFGIKSCGCLLKDREEVNKTISEKRREKSSRGGGSVDHPAEYGAWHNMIDRCYNSQAASYEDYGGRGITVCNEWRCTKGFEQFLLDMGKKPGSALTLERKNNSLGYSPENCEWRSYSAQNRNHRRNVNITFRGVTKCLTDWATDLGVSKACLDARLSRGWSIERTLTTPQYGSGRGRTSEQDLTYDGVTMSLVNWAKVAEIDDTTLRRRLAKGWTMEAALTTPPRSQKQKR